MVSCPRQPEPEVSHDGGRNLVDVSAPTPSDEFSPHFSFSPVPKTKYGSFLPTFRGTAFTRIRNKEL